MNSTPLGDQLDLSDYYNYYLRWLPWEDSIFIEFRCQGENDRSGPDGRLKSRIIAGDPPELLGLVWIDQAYIS